jgi:hypothetical protein
MATVSNSSQLPRHRPVVYSLCGFAAWLAVRAFQLLMAS